MTLKNDKFPVMQKRCDQCLFSTAKIVSEERKVAILADCVATGCYFICHKDREACCRGYFESGLTQNVQVLKRLADAGWAENLIEWITPEPGAPGSK